MNLYFQTTQKSLLFSTLLCLSVLSCNQADNDSKFEEVELVEKVEVLDNISYEIADHYFSKNNVDKNLVMKIETMEKFNETFGMATVMGMDTTNFPIDFSSNYVLAVILPENTLAKTIVPQDLIKKSDGNIEFTYSIQTTEEQTFSSQACLVVVVSKLNDGHILFIDTTPEK